MSLIKNRSQATLRGQNLMLSLPIHRLLTRGVCLRFINHAPFQLNRNPFFFPTLSPAVLQLRRDFKASLTLLMSPGVTEMISDTRWAEFNSRVRDSLLSAQHRHCEMDVLSKSIFFPAEVTVMVCTIGIFSKAKDKHLIRPCSDGEYPYTMPF